MCETFIIPSKNAVFIILLKIIKKKIRLLVDNMYLTQISPNPSDPSLIAILNDFSKLS